MAGHAIYRRARRKAVAASALELGSGDEHPIGLRRLAIARIACAIGRRLEIAGGIISGPLHGTGQVWGGPSPSG